VSGTVILVVLFGALLHAGWNAIVKAGDDKLLNIVLVNVGAAVLAAMVLPFLPLPAPESWPYLLASVGTQILYFLLVAGAYRAGDMSQAYPLMRGTAPLLVAVASGPLLGEALTTAGWIGVVLVSGGVLGIAFESRRRTATSRAATLYALANAGVIATYTMIDGTGVRASGNAAAYTLWIFLITAQPLLLWTLVRRPRALVAYARGKLTMCLVGGMGTLGSYGTALWAMTQAPVASVAALRETSILFATVIAVVVLKEKITLRRYLAIAVIAAGAVAIRLS
jgi:drug/metabolite transporter (DMT)-like permease